MNFVFGVTDILKFIQKQNKLDNFVEDIWGARRIGLLVFDQLTWYCVNS